MRWGWALLAIGLVLAAGQATAAIAPVSARVRNRWAAAGVHPTLQAFLDWWEQNGPFDIVVGQLSGYPSGGLRTAADAAGQAAACAAGLSEACDIVNTPHGRGAALDLWPADSFDPYLSWPSQPQWVKDQFLALGQAAEAFGLTWGGRWRTAKMPYGDQPHVELKNWRSLPFPPPAY